MRDGSESASARAAAACTLGSVVGRLRGLRGERRELVGLQSQLGQVTCRLCGAPVRAPLGRKRTGIGLAYGASDIAFARGDLAELFGEPAGLNRERPLEAACRCRRNPQGLVEPFRPGDEPLQARRVGTASRPQVGDRCEGLRRRACTIRCLLCLRRRVARTCRELLDLVVELTTA